MSELICKNIKVTYVLKKNQLVDGLDGLSINFKSGRVNVIIGENGCGKTTLFNCITGLIAYDGEIIIDGRNADNLLVKERKISYVQQSFVLMPNLTIFDNLAFPLKNQKLKPEEITRKVYEVLKLFDISKLMNCLPKQISIGQQQKVCLAKSLLLDPKILILDEAFSNIDVETKISLQRVVKEYALNNDITVLYVTHDLQDALNFGDYYYFITNSSVLLEGDKSIMNEKTFKEYIGWYLKEKN